MSAKPLKKVKVETAHYELRDEAGTVVATVVREGEYSRDNYPWGYYVADGFDVSKDAPRHFRSTKATDSMRDAVETLQIAWREGWIVAKAQA